jgi:hypothetical protein
MALAVSQRSDIMDGMSEAQNFQLQALEEQHLV